MPSVSSLIARIPGGIAYGLIWGILALGVYVTFRILKESDLTVDGSFTTGGAVAVMAIVNGVNPIIALFMAFISGVVAGICTGLIHTKLKIPAILSGILVQIGLYSINLHILGMVANVSCNPSKYNLLISGRKIPISIAIELVIAILLIVVMYWYFGTEQGSAIRATGDNYKMAKAQGINIDTIKIIGFALGNGIVAFAGGLLAQYQGYVDIGMGTGKIVTGLAAIIIGEVLLEAIFKKGSSFYIRLGSVIVGGIIYYLIMIVILWLKIDANDLKLATAIIVIICLAIPNLRKGGAK